jgi:carboxyl-terminal processing protease
MRHRVYRALRALGFAALVAPLGMATAWAQAPAVPDRAAAVAVASDELAAQVDIVLRQGLELEHNRRWSEAVAHYEDALRRFPESDVLRRRLELARTHWGIVRRYQEASFRQTLGQLAAADALQLYSDVLLKLDSYYVDPPDWRRLVDRGTYCFEVALYNEAFRAHHRLAVSDAQLGTFRSDLRNRLASLGIRTRAEARTAVHHAAYLAQQRLGLPQTAVILEYTCGMADSLDDYSAFLTKGELDEVYAQIEGNFVGLGIEIKPGPQGLEIVRVIPGSPAQRAGILAGDRIVAVDGQPTTGMNSDEAAGRLQGPEGSTVRVRVVTPEQPPRDLAVRREQVEVPSIEDERLLDATSGVAYLRLVSFQKTTGRELDAALWRLHDAGMKSLIIDLRGNPGGLLTAAVEAVDRFVDAGVIVSTRGRNAGEDFTYRAHRHNTWRVPLTVLIDGDSASASEIFAGAIRDHGRGTIVGTRSYGKGSVQGIFPLTTAGAGVRLTTARFYSPHGKPFHKVGVEPNVVVQQAARPIDGQLRAVDPTADPALNAAIQVAREQLAQRQRSDQR